MPDERLPPENLPAFIIEFFFETLLMAQATIDEGGFRWCPLSVAEAPLPLLF